RGKPSVSGGESKRQVPLSADKRIVNNGNWLFAGEGALYNASPSPQRELCGIKMKQQVSKDSIILNGHLELLKEKTPELTEIHAALTLRPVRQYCNKLDEYFIFDEEKRPNE
ncbi:MAG TPA: hypothetical protein VHO70_00620, partial [Chitinispirillaceae bacterium]|nr:hypothetical protein [Chitinispirillaceae bacterium]